MCSNVVCLQVMYVHKCEGHVLPTYYLPDCDLLPNVLTCGRYIQMQLLLHLHRNLEMW